METSFSLGSALIVTGLVIVLTVSSSLVLLRKYKQAIDRWMGQSTVRGGTAVLDHTSYGAQPSPTLHLPDMEAISRRARFMTSLVYLGAGLCGGALTAILVTTFGFERGLLPWRGMLPNILVFSWPVLVILAIVTTPARVTVAVCTVSYFLLLSLLGAWLEASPRANVPPATANAWESVPMWIQVLGLWTSQLLPTVAAIVLLNRRIRAVAPLMLVLSVFLVLTAHAVLTMTHGDGGLILVTVIAFNSLGGDYQPLVRPIASQTITATVVAFAIALPVAFLAGQLLARRYARKQESDQTLTTDAIWALYCWAAAEWVAIGGGWWAVTSVAAFATYKLSTRVGFRLIRRARHQRGPELLLLRRFKAAANSQRLYPLLEARWRWLGPIHLIGAPDLAAYTVVLSRFLGFLTGSLRRAFIADGDALKVRLETLDVTQDADGRFRVNELFCTESTWRAAVGALIARPTVIVVDARGLRSETHGGTPDGGSGIREELHMVSELRAFRRTVILCDTEESQQAVAKELRAADGDDGLEPPPEGRATLLRVHGNERIVIDRLIRHAQSVVATV